MGPDKLLLLLVDQSVDDLTGAEGVRPLLHLESVLNLAFPELKQVLLALGVVELDRVRDLTVGKLLWILLGFDELLEVVVEGVGQLSVLALRLEFEAEGEQVVGDCVVEVEQFGVLTQRVHDDLGHTRVEVDLWDQSLLVDDLIEVTVGHKDELLRGGIDFLSNILLLGVVRGVRTTLTLGQDGDEFVCAILLLNLLDDLVVFLDEVVDD